MNCSQNKHQGTYDKHNSLYGIPNMKSKLGNTSTDSFDHLILVTDSTFATSKNIKEPKQKTKIFTTVCNFPSSAT